MAGVGELVLRRKEPPQDKRVASGTISECPRLTSSSQGSNGGSIGKIASRADLHHFFVCFLVVIGLTAECSITSRSALWRYSGKSAQGTKHTQEKGRPFTKFVFRATDEIRMNTDLKTRL